MMMNKKQRKKLYFKILQSLLWLALFICALCVLGTLLFFIPLLSDLASMAFLPAYPYLVVLSAFLAIASIFIYKREKLPKNLAYAILSGVCITALLFMSVFTIVRVNAQGENINLLKAFAVSNHSCVKEEHSYYTDQNGAQIDLSVFYTEDGNENKPVLFYVHGGGWIQGSRYDRLDTTKTFAKNGYVVVSADYTLSNDDDHLYDFTEWQLLNALDWVEKNISSFHADAEKLYFTGDSAGGNIVLNLAYKMNAGVYAPYRTVKAVSVIYPVTSIRDFYESDNLLTSSYAKKMAVSYMGSIPPKEAGRYEEHNPKNYIGESTPPTLVTLGTSDSSVPVKSSLKFVKALEEKGCESKLIKVPFANHASDTNANNFLAQAFINNTLVWFEEHP